MNFLVDTNVIVEILLEQENASEARAALNLTGKHEFCISDFSLHSIGVILFRRNRNEVYQQFLHDLTFNARRKILYLSVSELGRISAFTTRFKLDFDDAYQYALADKYGLTILSYDRDFDRTDRGRKTPKEILAQN